MDDIHDLTALYVVDSLDEVQRDRYEEHLPACAECRAELELLDDGLRAPRDGLVLPASGPSDRGAAPGRRPPGLVVGVAAAAAAVSVVVAVSVGGEPDLVEQIHNADDVVEVTVAGSPFPSTRLVYSREVGRVLLVARDVPDPGDDLVYQLWLTDEGGPRPAGTFRPDGNPTTIVLEGTAESGAVVGLTVEPGDGSPQPTGDMLLSQPLE